MIKQIKRFTGKKSKKAPSLGVVHVKSTFNNASPYPVEVYKECMDIDGKNRNNHSNKSLVFNESKILELSLNTFHLINRQQIDV